MRMPNRLFFYSLLLLIVLVLLLPSVMGRRVALERDERRRVLMLRGEALENSISAGMSISEIDLDDLFFSIEDTLFSNIYPNREYVPILVIKDDRWLLLAPEINEMYDSDGGRRTLSFWLSDGGDLSEYNILYPNESWSQGARRP